MIAFTDSVFSKTYLTMLDNNGVPRFLRKINSFGDNFRPQINGKYSYTRTQVPGGNPLAATLTSHAVLGANLKEEQSGITTVGLSTTGFHEFLITGGGNYLVMAYSSSERDMSHINDDNGDPLSETESTRDSVIQEITPEGTLVYEWNSWGHIDLEDSRENPWFPDDYAHLNSLQMVDGDVIASLGGSSQVMKIDWDGSEGERGGIIWKAGIGESRSTYTIVDDPYEGFCGQHTASEIGNSLLLFDNGNWCDENRKTEKLSRVVEYSIDNTDNELVFSRHYVNRKSDGSPLSSSSMGSVQLLGNGNWLISRGNTGEESTTVNEVDSDGGDEVFSILATRQKNSDRVASYRAYRVENIEWPRPTGDLR